MVVPHRPVLKVLKADGLQIFRQLQLEAALLRGDPTNSNWFVMNAALPSPAIVMGISGYVRMHGFFQFGKFVPILTMLVIWIASQTACTYGVWLLASVTVIIMAALILQLSMSSSILNL